MSSAAMIGLVVALYAGTGLVVALAFVSYGVTRVPPAPASVTSGARLLLLPGAAVLWPVVLYRWLARRHQP